MASDRRGLTIVELLVGLFIVFISVCILAGVMVSTYSFFHRIQDRTSSVQLGDQLVRQSLWDGARGHFAGNPACPELAGYSQSADWWCSFPNYNPVFGSMTGARIWATTPTGNTMELERGWHDFGQGGIAVKNDGKVGYGMYYNDAETIGIWDDAVSAPLTTYPKMPVRAFSQPGNVPIPPNPGGMCWDSVNDILYVSDTGDGGTFPITNPETTNAWLGNPTGPGSKSICLQPNAPWIWGNGGHILWNDLAANMGTSTSTGNPPVMPLPPTLALGSATIVTFDPNDATSIWVTDEKYMCIRHYRTTTPNSWEPYQYKIAAGQRMGCPVLMVMVGPPAGPSSLVVYDGTNIWQFPSPANGVLTPSMAPCVLPSTLTATLHAIGWNQTYAGGDVVFFTDVYDHLYKYTISTNSFNATPIH